MYWSFLSDIDSNGIVDKYKIDVMKGQEEIKSITVNVSAKQRGNAFVLVGGLGIYTQYSFKIAAHNDKGFGQYSEPKSIFTQEGSMVLFSFIIIISTLLVLCKCSNLRFLSLKGFCFCCFLQKTCIYKKKKKYKNISNMK